MQLFPIQEFWWFYAGFTAFVLLLLALDLGVFHRKAHAVSLKEATVWSVVWIALSLAFNVFLYFYTSWHFPDRPELPHKIGLEFLTGYLIEKALSVANIFVFVVIFSFVRIAADLQHRVLFYGILGALIFRAMFIAVGSALMNLHWMVIVFGLFLIFTGIRMVFGPDKDIEPEKNPIIRLFRRVMPITPALEGKRFFVRKDGRLHGAPLLVTLLFVELTDILFAVDSVPAIFAITD